jgi:hypothetical protein
MHKLSLLLLILVMALGATALAQSETIEYCGEMSEEDCDLYYEFQNALQLPDSTEFELNTAITALIDGAEFEANINATGSYVYDITIVEDYLEDLEDVPLIDASVGDFVDFLESGVDAFDAELFIEVTLPTQAAMIVGSRTQAVNLWLIDSEAYVDLTPIADQIGDPSLAGVFGVDVFDLLNISLETVTLGDIIDMLETADMGGLDDPDFQRQLQQQFSGQALQAQFTEADMAGFVTVRRLEDEEIDGAEVAVFETVVDVAAIFENDRVRRQIELSFPPEAVEEISADEIAEALVDALGGSTLTVVEKYDTDSEFLIESETVYDLIIDPVPFMELGEADMAMMDEESAVEEMEEAIEEGMEGEMATEEAPMDEMTTEEAPIEEELPDVFEVDVVVTFNRFNINGLDAIELPEDTELIPAQDLIDLLTGPQTQPVDF